MKLSRVLKAKNTGTRVIFLNNDELINTLQTLPDYIEIVLREEKHIRSKQQNKYYWGVVVDTLATELGYLPDEMHEVLKTQFLKEHVKIQHGFAEKEVEVIKSTTDLSTKEMEEYCEHIRIWAIQEFGVRILTPNEVDV